VRFIDKPPDLGDFSRGKMKNKIKLTMILIGCFCSISVLFAANNQLTYKGKKDVAIDVKSRETTFNIDNQYKSICEIIKISGDLIKTGSETLAFEVAPVLTGDIYVKTGNFHANCDFSDMKGKIFISSGATIGGTGSLPSLTLPNGATIAPGNSIGTLNAGNLYLNAGSKYDWEVGTSSADLINVNGNLTIPTGGMTINVIDAGLPNGSLYTLFKTSLILGNVTNINMSYGIGVAGPANPIQVGNDIVATIVPEPGFYLLFIIYQLLFIKWCRVTNASSF